MTNRTTDGDSPSRQRRRLLSLATTLLLALSLLSSATLLGCGARKPPLPAKDIKRPRYPPR